MAPERKVEVFMKGYPIKDDETGRAVMAVQKLHLEGNIIPHSWFENLQLKSGKPNLPAIILLSDIVYSYRPIKELDDYNNLICYRKRFRGDCLQRKRKNFGARFGFGVDQVKNALAFLQEQGVITRHYRTLRDASGDTLNNVLFIELHTDVLEAITYPVSLLEKEAEQEFEEIDGLPLGHTGPRVGRRYPTYTEQSSFNNSKRSNLTVKSDSNSKRSYEDELDFSEFDFES